MPGFAFDMYPGAGLWAIRRYSLEITAWLLHASKGICQQINIFTATQNHSLVKRLAKQEAGKGECGSRVAACADFLPGFSLLERAFPGDE